MSDLMIVERSVPFELRDVNEGNGDGLTLDGYAAVWNSPTRIDSHEGCFDEQIQRGAFAKTIREKTPILQFDHGRHNLIGSIPIGKITGLQEDDKGLRVQARLSNNWLVEPVRQAIADKAINGMSFRFEVNRDNWTDANGIPVNPKDVKQRLFDSAQPMKRTLTEVKCRELGPVVWPAYEDTSVGVRARAVANEILGDATMRRHMLSELMRSAEEDTPAEHDGPMGPDGLPSSGDYRAKNPKKPYGENIPYADPGYQEDGKARYPLDTKDHVKAALSYLGQVDNQKPYTSEQLSLMMGRIKAAAKKFGIQVSEEKGIEIEDFPVRDVALALLYGDDVRDVVPEVHPSESQDDAPLEEHPSEPDSTRDAPPVVEPEKDDAPLPEEHPSEVSSVSPSVLKQDAKARSLWLAEALKRSDKYDA